MKQYILLLVLMVMGAGMTVHAEDVNPVKVGNVISGHIIEKGTEASLPYATILIVETGQGTVSDENGEENPGRKIYAARAIVGLRDSGEESNREQ